MPSQTLRRTLGLALVLAASLLPADADANTDAAHGPSALATAGEGALTLALAKPTRPPPEPFVYTAEPHYEAAHFVTGEPGSKRAAKLFELAQTIAREGSDLRYSHRTKIRRGEGVYHFDCSGMLNWMLARVSKQALATLDRERPVAATYAKTMARAPGHKRRDGWREVERIEDLRPGDIFAWRRPTSWPKGGNTGHAGIVAALPEPVDFIAGAYLVRIYDSTRYAHQDDARAESGATGFGSGTILFMADDQGEPIGYAWYGSQSSGWYRTEVAFGRI
ncbi:hypothetical protein G6O69_12735 [Pseudenhygromyxa sp. WMMC2535]|uniref:hypothetical protein n=1 Tax=Pseudenhygromyxa sp. WMMC2535 TaxID=2712867 RepID=UPI0015559453|nr:hypothetical protein [Pseudenhygromyxa sp. WMMC2535]NVB38700.1 hypothetical protein [Pseudenhygromyxa sp. WMMC2535]